MLNRIQQFINKDLKLTAVRISATIQFQQCKIFEWISEDTRQAGEALLCQKGEEDTLTWRVWVLNQGIQSDANSKPALTKAHDL